MIPFTYDARNARTVGAGVYFAIGSTPAGPLYVEQIAPDSNFPAFRDCPRLATG
jgi:hypothetical protein